MSDTPDISEEAKLLLVERSRARDAKDWAASDTLRDTLLKEGISVKDTPNGTFWLWSKDAA